jgi:hypothetical protein
VYHHDIVACLLNHAITARRIGVATQHGRWRPSGTECGRPLCALTSAPGLAIQLKRSLSGPLAQAAADEIGGAVACHRQCTVSP